MGRNKSKHTEFLTNDVILVFGWNTHNALVSEIANFADIQQFMLQLVTFLH
jgi:hypothetical protein